LTVSRCTVWIKKKQHRYQCTTWFDLN